MSLSWFALTFPNALTDEAVVHFTRTLAVRPRRGLLMTADPVVAEVHGHNGRLIWYLGISRRDEAQVLTALRRALPDLQASETTAPTDRPSVGWEVRLSSSRRVLRTDAPEQLAGALLSAVGAARKGELVVWQVVIGPWLHRPVVPPARMTTRQPTTQRWLDVDELVLNSEQARALRDKQAEPVYGVVGRIAIQAATKQRRRMLRQQVMGALQLARVPGAGLERRLLPTNIVGRRVARAAQPLITWSATLNAAELACLIGWPIGNPILSGVSYSGHRHLPAPEGNLLPLSKAEAVPRRLRVTGRSTFPGQSGLLTLAERDGLHHVICTGPTGTGKSTWLASMALQDIAAGRGVVVVDPKGDLVEAIADRIPAQRIDNVVLLDPSSPSPVGFNPLNSQQPDLSVDSVQHIPSELYSANWGPRTADVLHNSLSTLVRIKGMTLCELPPLLQNREFRRRIVDQVRNDQLGVAPFWHWFESLSEPQRGEVIAPALNKLRPFTSRTTIRGVIGQSDGFDLLEVFTKRRILLVSLAKGDLGSESAQLLGALLVGSLWNTILRRSQITPERRHPAFVYLDEFADVLRLPVDLGDALTQARGLGVGLVLAHQHVAQLPPRVRAAVAANARSKIVFQSDYDDATTLAKSLGGGLTANDLQGLRAFETYQALTQNGRTMSPASVATMPLMEPLGRLDVIRRRSQQQYGQARAETDAAIKERRTAAATDTPIGARPRRGSA